MRLIVLQHIACEHPGIFRRFLQDDGIGWDTVELDAGEPIPDLSRYDAMLVMGGPMDVWDVDELPWLVAEKQAIRHFVRDLKRPYFGFCLGHQLLADALGGTCGPQRPPEIGMLDVELTGAAAKDRVFMGLPKTVKGLQWHSVRVAQPPEDAVVLASSPACRCQAMRVGDLAWSVQFHIEIDASTIPEWGCVPAYAAALDQVRGEGALARMAREAEPDCPALAANARILYRNFIGVVRGNAAARAKAAA